MTKKKIINFNKSQLIDLICETVLEVSNLNEAMEDTFNPAETGEIESEKNHYLDKVPDKGFQKFWHDWNDKGMSDEDFSKKHKKTKEQFKKDIEDEIDQAANDARDYYKSYYSKNNPDVYKKLIDKEATPSNRRNDQMNELKRQNALNYIHMMLDKIADGGWNWTHKGHDGGTNIWYGCDELKKKHPSAVSWACDSWGWVANSLTGRYTYNMNVYKFTNPTISGWKQKIYGTTVHEIGHLMQRFLEDMGISAYQYISHDRTDITMPKDKDGSKNYVDAEWETYARIHQLRRVFDVTSNISAREWANLFMDKVDDGEITFYMDGIDEDANKRNKSCQKIETYQQMQEDGTELRVADANKIQEFLKKKGFNIATDGSFGDETAHAVLQYLDINIGGGMVPTGWGGAEEILRKMMVQNHPIFSDGIGGQSQAIITDELYKKCKKHQKTWIPPVTFELAKSGKRVIITLSKQLLTQQYSGKHGNADGVPDTFNNIWSIMSDIRFSGEKFSDITALFTKFSFDLKNFKTPEGDNKDNVYLIIDFEKIEEVNDIFVKDNMEYEFDDLTHPTDTAKV